MQKDNEERKQVLVCLAASTYYSVMKGQHMSQFNKHYKLSFNALIESAWSKQTDLKTYMFLNGSP